MSHDDRIEAVDQYMKVNSQRSTKITEFTFKENYFQPKMDVI